MEKELRTELRGHAWAYFDRHAEQRLKTFNFYLILAGAIIAGIISSARTMPAAWVLPFLLAGTSFVFWKLDVRNRTLTKHSEEALKYLADQLPLSDEAGGVPHRCKLFRREQYESELQPRFPIAPLTSARFSYTTCFNCIFFLFGWGGVLLGVTLLLLDWASPLNLSQSS